MIDPEFYAYNYEPLSSIIMEQLDMYLDKFQWRFDKKDSVIDIGTGPGDMLFEIICPMFRREFESIVCSDFNRNMVEYCKSRYNYVDRCEFKVFDIATEEDISSDLKGQFDHVISFNCLHFVENQKRAFENIFKLLRPDIGGDCYLQMFCGGPYYDAYTKLSKSPKWCNYMNDINKYTPCWHNIKNPETDASRMLEKCGFSDITVNVNTTFFENENIEIIKDTLLAISPYVHHMPKDLHQEFISDLIEELQSIDDQFKVSNESGEIYRFNIEILNIYAKREKN